MNFKRMQSALFLVLLLLSTLLFFWLIGSYIMPLFWALVLTIVFYPVYKKFVYYTKGRTSLASFLTIILILITVFVPLYILSTLIIREAVSLYTVFTQSGGTALGVVYKVQALLSPLQSLGIDTNSLPTQITSFMQNSIAEIGLSLLAVGKFTIQTLVGLFIMLYILFFTLRDGVSIGTHVMHVFPLDNDKERMLCDRLITLVQVLFKGTFIIAILQGLLGVLLFLAVGIQGAFLWAFVMGIFALIPAVGPAVVWLPVGILLLVTGSTWQGIAVLLVGMIVISSVDNFLRPALVAKGAAMPDLLIFLSILGGLTLFGMAGIIIGPIITALFLSMWSLFESDYKKELKEIM